MHEDTFFDQLDTNFKFNNLKFDSDKSLIFYKFYNSLINENKKYNLTSLTTSEDIIQKHFIDSILPLCQISSKIDSFNFKDFDTIIDFGCGAGFPLLPFLIFSDDKNFIESEFFFIDSNNKKILFLKNFLEQIKAEFGININCRHDRIEDLLIKDSSNKKILLLGRAITKYENLLNYIKRFIKLNQIEEISFIYLAGPKFNAISDNQLKKIFNNDFKISQFFYKYNHSKPKFKRVLYLINLKKLSQICR